MDQRNLLLAIVISVAILIGFQVFYDVPRQEAEVERQEMLEQRAGVDPTAPPVPLPGTAPGTAPDTAPALPGSAVPGSAAPGSIA